MTFADSNGLLPSSATTPVMDARETGAVKENTRRRILAILRLIWQHFFIKSLGLNFAFRKFYYSSLANFNIVIEVA
jgi:hypothetical protein